MGDTPNMAELLPPILRRRSEDPHRSEPDEPNIEIARSGSVGDGEDFGRGGAGGATAVGQSAPSESLRYVFEVAKSEVDSQLTISERIDSKARSYITITAAFFAAAQALALRQDVLHRLGGTRDTVVTVATVAGSIVGAALIAAAIALFVFKDKSFESKPLFEWLNDISQKRKPEPVVAEEVVEAYITLFHRRRQRNVVRARWLIVVQVLCIAGIGASILQLILALHGLA